MENNPLSRSPVIIYAVLGPKRSVNTKFRIPIQGSDIMKMIIDAQNPTSIEPTVNLQLYAESERDYTKQYKKSQVCLKSEAGRSESTSGDCLPKTQVPANS